MRSGSATTERVPLASIAMNTSKYWMGVKLAASVPVKKLVRSKGHWSGVRFMQPGNSGASMYSPCSAKPNVIGRPTRAIATRHSPTSPHFDG
jgi:hypothetical protein